MKKYRYIKALLLLLTLPVLVVNCRNFLTNDHVESGSYYSLIFPLIPVPDQGTLPDSILSVSQLDASRLTVRIMHELGGDSADEIELPVDLTNSLLNGLGAIFAANDVAARDSVIDMYNIHTRSPQLYEIIVSADSAHRFMQAWAVGERFTGHAEIDSLMMKYDLYLDSYHDRPWQHKVVLRSGRPLNMTALASRFESLEEVTYSEINGFCCDGPDLTIDVNDDAFIYTYRLKWGYCPVGCGASHNWLFEVDFAGTVSYLGSTGSTLP